MPEIEQPEPVLPLHERPRCAHDVTPWRRFIPEGIAIGDGGRGFVEVLPFCPYVVMTGSSYCYAHTILNDAVTPNVKDEIEGYIGLSIKHYARGLLINPPLPDGTLYYPGWWSKRFN